MIGRVHLIGEFEGTCTIIKSVTEEHSTQEMFTQSEHGYLDANLDLHEETTTDTEEECKSSLNRKQIESHRLSPV